MSCHAILKNLYEPKMDAILTISFKIINRDNKTYVLCPTLQTRTCIGVLKSIIMSFHSFIAMEYAFTLFFLLLMWLDWIFLGGYLQRLSINYVGMSKYMGKRLPQLYYIKMKICYDLGFNAIGVAMAT